MYKFNRQMITRIFLFVLAIVTGVSAAQAAPPVRAAQSEVWTSVSVGGSAINTAAIARTAEASRYVFALAPSYASSVFQQVLILQNQALPFPRTFNSDRSRQ
jgi:hypothetical protein